MNKGISMQSAIDRATSETLLRSDPNYNSLVKDMINSRPDLPKEAIQYLKKRVISRNPKVQLLTLELLEFLVANTALPFHTQVASRDFLSSLAQVYRSRDVDSEVKNKLKSNLISWYRRFAEAHDILPGFSDIYTQLKLGGEIESPGIRPSSLAAEGQSYEKRLPAAKAQKLKQDLQVVKENISLTNEMIEAGESASSETLEELVGTLKAMDGKLLKLTERLEDEEMMSYVLKVSDDLQEVLKKYNELKQGRFQPKKNQADLLFEEPPASKKHDHIGDLLIDSFSPPPQSGFSGFNQEPLSFTPSVMNPIPAPQVHDALSGLFDAGPSSFVPQSSGLYSKPTQNSGPFGLAPPSAAPFNLPPQSPGPFGLPPQSTGPFALPSQNTAPYSLPPQNFYQGAKSAYIDPQGNPSFQQNFPPANAPLSINSNPAYVYGAGLPGSNPPQYPGPLGNPAVELGSAKVNVNYKPSLNFEDPFSNAIVPNAPKVSSVKQDEKKGNFDELFDFKF